MVVLTMKLAETDVKMNASAEDFRSMPFTLWCGTDDVGRSVSCWIPDWVPASLNFSPPAPCLESPRPYEADA